MRDKQVEGKVANELCPQGSSYFLRLERWVDFRWRRQCSNSVKKVRPSMAYLGTVSGLVYMTQRIQVEDQWESKVRRGWGPS